MTTALPAKPLTPINHNDHLRLVCDDVSNALKTALNHAQMPVGLVMQNPDTDNTLLVCGQDFLTLHQVFALKDGAPSALLSAFPVIKSGYGIHADLVEVFANGADAILHLNADGTDIYAFDTLYPINGTHYQHARYYVNFAALAHELHPSDDQESTLITDPVAVRHHRAYSAIVGKQGRVPDDIDAQIDAYLENHAVDDSPIKINMAKMCAYLYGERGQEDEAWCQGQIIKKTAIHGFGCDFWLFDTVILREKHPWVLPIIAKKDAVGDGLAVGDYLHASIWLQAAIYATNQDSV